MYSEIAKLVQQRVDKDQGLGVPEAMVLRDNVDRKLVKQTVMTSVYGVTFVGARQQIGNRLKERGWDDERLVYKTSCYGARVSFLAAHLVFQCNFMPVCSSVCVSVHLPVCVKSQTAASLTAVAYECLL